MSLGDADSTADRAVPPVAAVSIEVPLDELFAQVDDGRWGFCYLLTVSDDARPHLLALRPAVEDAGAGRVLRFDAGGGRAPQPPPRRSSTILNAHTGTAQLAPGAAESPGGERRALVRLFFNKRNLCVWVCGLREICDKCIFDFISLIYRRLQL